MKVFFFFFKDGSQKQGCKLLYNAVIFSFVKRGAPKLGIVDIIPWEHKTRAERVSRGHGAKSAILAQAGCSI